MKLVHDYTLDNCMELNHYRLDLGEGEVFLYTKLAPYILDGTLFDILSQPPNSWKKMMQEAAQFLDPDQYSGLRKKLFSYEYRVLGVIHDITSLETCILTLTTFP